MAFLSSVQGSGKFNKVSHRHANNTTYISKGSDYMSSTHTLHDFVLYHRSKQVMATTTTNTTDIGQQTVPKAHKISMSSNQFGLVEIVEVIRTSDQVETVNRLESDVVSIDVDTIVREPTCICNSAAKHKDFSRIMVFNNSGIALLRNNRMNNSFND